jgi:hypothetical protein
MTCFPASGPPVQIVAEPQQTVPGESPVCEIWHEVWPNFCREFHINNWVDANGDSVLSECDDVYTKDFPGGPETRYHIDRIACDIIVTEKPITPTKHRSWGWIKSLFRR